MDSENSKQEGQSTERADQPTDEYSETADVKVSPSPDPAMPQPPPTPSTNATSEHKRRDWFDYTKFVAEVIGLVVLIFYTVFAGVQACTMNRTLDEIRKQTPKIAESADAAWDITKLTRQQLIGTQAAILHIRFQVLFQYVISGPPAQGLRAIVEYTSGSAMASDIHESFDVVWETVPGLRNIGKPQHFDFVLHEFRRDDAHGPSVTAVPVDGLTSEVWEPIKLGKANRTIKVSGTFRYKNGFDEVPAQPFCFIWYSHPTVFNTMYQDFIACPEYASVVSFYASMERKEAEAQSHQKQ